MALDVRQRWIASKLTEAYGVSAVTSEAAVSKHAKDLEAFFIPGGPAALTWYYQAPAAVKRQVGPGVQPAPQLFLASPQSEPMLNNVVYFLRSNAKGVTEKTYESDMVAGQVSAKALESYRALLGEVFVPVLTAQEGWGKATSKHATEMLQAASAFTSALDEALGALHGAFEPPMPNPEIIAGIEAKPAALSKAAVREPVITHCNELLDAWSKIAKDLLAMQLPASQDSEAAARSRSFNAWNALEQEVSEAAQEARDNVKYLGTLEQSIAPLRTASLPEMLQALPAFFSALYTLQTTSRYYAKPENLGSILGKVAWFLARTCRRHITSPGPLWDQKRTELVTNLNHSVRVHEVLLSLYRQTKERSKASSNSSKFEVDEGSVFGRFDLFAKRCRKLSGMFSTIEQFSVLSEHTHVKGLSAKLERFTSIVEDIKGRPYDLLDFTVTQFDRDILEFNVHINELELALKAFVDDSFKNIQQTDGALDLLGQFEAILQRDSLKADLAAKYQVVFQSYGKDLETVQQLYEAHKGAPPLPRNTPPVAGNVAWSRQLLRRIEGPMQMFARVPALMQGKDNKRIIGLYNRLARALLEFEGLWLRAWHKGLEVCLQGLQAPLIVRHPDSGKLLVNFDRGLAQTMAEAKALARMRVPLPEQARVVLLQEEKFQVYYDTLTHALQEHERVLAQVPDAGRVLLKPHMDDIEARLRPGAYLLTWTSLNIDGYLHHLHTGLTRLEELVRKMNDVLQNRVDANLTAIARTCLIDLPTDAPVTSDEFTALQAKHTRADSERLAVKNNEVKRSIEELINEVKRAPRDNSEVVLAEEDCQMFRFHFSRLLFQAILTATKNSLGKMGKRLGGRVAGYSLEESPLFTTSLQLSVPVVICNPALGDIQTAVNTAAKKVLNVSRNLKMWGRSEDAPPTFYELIAQDKEIVKAVLLLTGAIEGAEQAVQKYTATFDTFAFLWKTDLATEYAAFIATNPNLEAFENELRKHLATEREVGAIVALHTIGSLALDSAPLKASLRAEAASWKTQFAKNLQKQGATDLAAFDAYVKDTTAKLGRKINDLEDVHILMPILKEIRHREANLDGIIAPIQDMYALLTRYEVRLPKDELDAVSDLRYSWRKLNKLALEVSNNLAKLQAGFKKLLTKEVANFVVDARNFRADWELSGPMVPNLAPLEAVERLKKFQQLFEVRKQRWDSYSKGEELFGMAVTKYPGLEKTEEEIQMLDRLYSLYVNVITTIKGYGNYLWTDVVAQIDRMGEEVNAFQAQCKRLPKGLREWPAFVDCKTTIDTFLAGLPLLQSLAHKSMRPRHWKEVMRITATELNMAEDVLRLQHLLDAQLVKHQEEVEELCSCGVKEEQIEIKLGGVVAQWGSTNFNFGEFKSHGAVTLKPSETAEVVTALEEGQMLLGSMASNRYAAPFREEVVAWLKRLDTVSECLESWLGVQSLWMYMEAVFSGGDIVKQLPAEAKRFQAIDKNFKKVVAHATETRNVVATCCGTELLKTLLPHLTEQLELCQKSLTAYLETKRAEFPRFYFVSDPTLLEILSLGSDPPSVVPHFQSGLFDSLTSVTFDKVDKSKMTQMFSQQQEMVPFEKPVEVKGMVEVWLAKVVEGMQTTMKNIIKRANSNVNEQTLPEFLFSHPAQIALLGLQFQWTGDTQAALSAAKTDKNSMNRALKKSDAILKEMVALTLRSDLTRNMRTSLETCITVHMHQKESTEDLVKKKIRDPTDFEWLKQCRFYWREDRDTVVISICDVDFDYSFEYLGVKERLVITPLTDICYVTLSQALGMFLGGAPAGPAGTGKTETTKDLGNTLGKYVVVFNCSDQMDFKGMGKIYKGLAQSGLWGCFDEFNRINLDVLSVCAQQVYCVLSAIRERRKTFIFTDGSSVSLDPRVGYFITMNPGYAGRQELPENLKALFRGVTMMVPNRQIIMKVKLAACGYQENDMLAKKFFVLYGLCEQQLSKQPHYDFGLRNILSVLRTAGASKRANPTQPETALMMRTLRDMNMSKFVAEDVPLFLSLIDDLFPGQNADRASFPEVSAALAKVVAEKGLQAHTSWLNKCIQLYETYLVRHGIMVVGPAGSGKTAITECLAGALTELGTKHVIWRMNPKAITAPQMFGRMDASTGDWTDGIFAVLWRRAAKQKTQNTWIVLDGPVDAIWIENLNTVLDDNKVLTLANGDRILMTPQMKAVFEPENLANASPATISRAGIIYVSDSELGWAPVVKSWCQARPAAVTSVLEPCFEKYVQPVLDFIRVSCKPVLHNETVSQVQTLLTLLEGVLKSRGALGGDSAPEGSVPPDAKGIERIFLFCLAWGVGGLLDKKDRIALDAELRKLTDLLPKQGKEKDPPTIYEHLVAETSSEWVNWQERVPDWKYPPGGARFSQLVIPTMDSLRFEHLLGLTHSVNKASLLVGGPGTAKTTVINSFLSKFSSDTNSSKTITFSSLSTPAIFQTTVEGSVEKRQGRTYGPPGGKVMTMFIDDISMPAVNEWGDQITNELVRQLLEQGGMYSLEKPIGDMKFVTDMRYVAAMNVPGGGKNDIPNRLKRQFANFHVPQPSTAALNNIFGALVQGRFDPALYGSEVADVALKLVPLTVALWEKVQAKMLPTPAKFHYLFNMRDLSKVFQGVLLAAGDRFAIPKAGADMPSFAGTVSSPGGYLLSLWQHESQRTFCDKMISAEDKTWVSDAIHSLCKKEFSRDLVQQLETPCEFVNFLREPEVDPATGEVTNEHPSYYEAVPGGMPDVKSRVEAIQKRFVEGKGGGRAELVLFEDALAHLTRLTRIFAMDRASALLVGVGGSGKQSLARLAAHIAGAYTFQPTITKQYNTSNLLEDIKNLYKVAAFRGTPVVFIFSDSEVKEEAFLEYINQLLMTGEVTGLFPKDELDTLINDIRPIYKAECPGGIDTYEALYSFFLGRVRDRLHVCLCFSPVGPQFAKRAQQFPGLINGTTIDWFLPWPEEALISVAEKFLAEFPMMCTAQAKRNLITLMGNVHGCMRQGCQEYFERYRRNVFVTPKSFLSFIGGYKQMYDAKLKHTQGLATAISGGLQKMADAKKDVNQMKGELAIKNVELQAASKEAEVLLSKITASTTVAEKEKARVAVIVDGVTAKANEISAVKISAEKDLAAAKPALDAAVAALNSITPKDIVGLKALKSPPDIIKRIFDCVLLLRYFPVNKVSWQDIKGSKVILGTYEESVKMMGDMNFLTALTRFPKEGINEETVELLQPYFAAPDFTFDSAKKASGNVAGLCSWAQAMVTYHKVATEVEPKIVMLRQAEEDLYVATKEKDAAEADLAVVQATLDDMQAQFEAAMRQKKALADDAQATQFRMDSANSLLSALAGEEARWTAQSAAFAATIEKLTGDCLLASSFLSYLGPFNKEFREVLLTRELMTRCSKLDLPFSKDFSPSTFVVESPEIGEWTLQGLPKDELSIQNGALVTRATRAPVLIDPQGQGRAWLKNREGPNGLKVVSLSDKHFRVHLEECMSMGKPLLIENIEEELDPVLDPVLERRVIRKGKTLIIALADKEVDFSEDFRLFCTTRLPNPRYTPELSAMTTIVDFTVTAAGLEDQLLGKLILKEKQELEEQRRALSEEVIRYRAKIKQLENDLLFRLSNSQGNLLEDTELVEVLAVTKATAAEVAEKLTTASETEKKIKDACEEFRPVAHRATLLYFLIAEFSNVNCMYQTSLAQFNGLYEESIDKSEKAALPNKRMANIMDHLTWEIYLYIQRGLFERHKLVFALILATKIWVSAGKIRAEEVDIFLKGGSALDITSVRKKPKEWIPDMVWLEIVALSATDALRDLPDSVTRNDAAWRAWYDNEAPERTPIPDFQTRITKFTRMCIVKAFREDRTLLAASDFIADALGQRFVESVPLNLERALAESAPNRPLICLLSPGADPTKLIEDLAKRNKVRTLGVSMGQGQEVIARKLMAQATVEGQWVLLQNTHLGLGFLSEVEGMLAKAEGLHEGFRLWITAEPHPAFPIGLLQIGLKLTNEAPVGIRAGLRASYQWVSQDLLDAVNRPEWRQLLFVLCYLHSCIQERRKFGPIGWNVPYEFNQSDLAACAQFLQNHLLDMEARRASGPTWDTVRYMIAQIQYGGRITDDFDALLMRTFAAKYFHQAVLQPKYVLYKSDKGNAQYDVPEGTEIEVFRKAIEDMPAEESPEVFGLHANADLTFRTLQARDRLQIFRDTRPAESSRKAGASREEVVDKMAEDLLAKVPQPFDKEDIRERLRKLTGGPTAPLNVHLRQEIDRLNIIIRITTTSLKNLRLAVAGTIALSGSLVDAFEALFAARIPKDWLKKSWEAAGLGSWFSGLLARHEQLNKWLYNGRPKSFWMTGFFNPQGFLTAMKQEVNRKHAGDKWALDDVVMVAEVTHPAREAEQIKDAPAEGVYIHGLYLDGCAWSTKENRLVDAEPKKLFNPLPVLYVTGVQAKDVKKAGTFDCPVYRVKQRTGLNFITTFQLRTDEEPSKWTMRGVGLLCSVD
ncbi:hypothetical protein WJX73_010224 [Symbiochloris irregularis]|uniref:AAA+ ATPase domain-containing protein n=1 Tax=Symbiochloris irregularis TaxID=706552 RepID=A0AAW1NUE3_9CHLO